MVILIEAFFLHRQTSGHQPSATQLAGAMVTVLGGSLAKLAGAVEKIWQVGVMVKANQCHRLHPQFSGHGWSLAIPNRSFIAVA